LAARYGGAVVQEDPIALLGRLRLGREEYCQRLLTMLILGDGYPKWNSMLIPSNDGLRFLQSLDRLCFADQAGSGALQFVDEFELPARHDDEPGGAPDWAVLWKDRVWMVELKTEPASHRRGQLSGYLELAAHYYPTQQIDLTYLTPPMLRRDLAVPSGIRFRHIGWDDVRPLIGEIWGGSDAQQKALVDELFAALDGLGTDWRGWRSSRLGEPVQAPDLVVDDASAPYATLASALAAAERTSIDGGQRAVDARALSLEDLQELRLELREALTASDSAELRRVRPWLWSARTSGGEPMTPGGAESGYEVRLSRYEGSG